jgi:hypothetical protein
VKEEVEEVTSWPAPSATSPVANKKKGECGARGITPLSNRYTPSTELAPILLLAHLSITGVNASKTLFIVIVLITR